MAIEKLATLEDKMKAYLEERYDIKSTGTVNCDSPL